MNLTQNYYQLFGIPQSFWVDQELLSQKYRQLQRELHPDRFAGKSASEQRLSVQLASLVNSAYQTLKSPLLTAEYLLNLAEHPVNSDSMTVDDGQFLFKQMEWREQLSDLSGAIQSKMQEPIQVSEQLDELREEVSDERQQLINRFSVDYDKQCFENAKQVVAKLHFIEKMLVNIDCLEDDLIA